MVEAKGHLEMEFWEIGEVAREFPWLLWQEPRNRRVSNRREVTVSEVMEDEVLLHIARKRSLAILTRTV